MAAKQPFKLPPLFSNKYFIGTVAFIIWLCFLDRYNLIAQFELSAEKSKMEHQKEFYLSEIEKNTRERQELLSSPEKLEKFAREKYFMKKDNEDLYIIVPEKSSH
ncbi:septum formation initiator [Chitinophaga caeni]|uniref:Septum formation initiator n=1 Tax=Chitinophaga caeni TaxID=2029983 RepID=A0A291QQP6_9BACT|nr:septum formation initiator family protein [Chitinophaga caeni]ATL46202.1 septum formation initiator [Chitinophaga caeni]